LRRCLRAARQLIEKKQSVTLAPLPKRARADGEADATFFGTLHNFDTVFVSIGTAAPVRGTQLTYVKTYDPMLSSTRDSREVASALPLCSSQF
ncbi:hypothetical protein ACTGYF_11105, partial [Streptococcus suis]